MSRLRIVLFCLTGAVLVSGAAFLAEVSRSPHVARPAQETGREADWAARGEQIRSAKRESAARGGYMGNGVMPVNIGDYAYRSSPVDIIADGVYELTFGVESRFNYPQSPTGYGIDFPNDKQFKAKIRPGLIVTNVAGERVARVSIAVSGLEAPYFGFSGWLH